MNDRDLLELHQLRTKEQNLRQELEAFANRIRALETRLQAAAALTIEPEAAPPPIPPLLPSPPKPVLRIATRVVEPAPLPQSSAEEAMGRSVGPCGKGPYPDVEGSVGPCGKGPNQGEAETPAPPILAQPATPKPRFVQAAVPQKPESFEMRLGTYWFVRVGVVLLLTALAFLGNYAYQNFVFKMGASGKVALLYTASFLLLGTGAWLRRKNAVQSLKNYAEVLFAGGLAAVYFTTYAAHHIDRLRVIQSPVLDGTLLLAWAAFIVWLADRRKSEVMAMFALGLAYYTATITRTGSFTLYSNLVLTMASVFFLARNRWAALSALALPATYGSYAFWRFHAHTGWRFPSPEEGLVFSAAFLAAYWLVFTAAVFLSKHEQSKGPARAAFLSLNNGAALSLFLLTMLQLHTGGLWKVCMGFGSVLLVLAWVSRKVLPDDRLAEDSYLVQGLALVTTGIIARFSGNDLPLLLAAESVILFILGCRLQNIFIRGGGWISALLAVAWAMDLLQPGRQSTLYVGLAVSAALLTNTLFAHRRSKAVDLLRPEVSYFALLLVVMLGCVCWAHSERANLAAVVMAVALLLTFSMHVLRIRDIVLFSQALGLFALFAWVANAVARSGPWEPWTQPVLTIISALALLHWWQHQKAVPLQKQARAAFQALYALSIMIVLFTWVMPHVHARAVQHVVPAMTAMVIALTVYSAFTRSAVLAITAQFFLVPVILLFAEHLSRNYSWQPALVPPLAFFLLASGAAAWRRSHTELSTAVSSRIQVAAQTYYWVGLALLALCIASYVPARNCPWVYALVALVPFALAGARTPQALPYALALLICAVVAFVIPAGDKVWAHLTNLIYVAILLGVQRVARRMHERYQLPETLHNALIVLGSLSLWLLLSRYVQQNVTGFLLTVTWSAVALVLFGLGMALRERSYRWLGLVVLGASLARIVLMDVWKLELIYRIFSFMALGLVLVLLGYVYNRFQEKIRSWL